MNYEGNINQLTKNIVENQSKLEKSLSCLLSKIISEVKEGKEGNIDYIENIDDAIKNTFYNDEYDENGEKKQSFLEQSGLLSRMINLHNNNEIVKDFKIKDGMFTSTPLSLEGKSSKKIIELSGSNDPRKEVKLLKLLQWINNTKRYLTKLYRNQIEDYNKNTKGNCFDEKEIFSKISRAQSSNMFLYLKDYVNGNSKNIEKLNKNEVEKIDASYKSMQEICKSKGIDENLLIKTLAFRMNVNVIQNLKASLISEFLHFCTKNSKSDVDCIYLRDDKEAKSKKDAYDKLLGVQIKNFSEPFEFHVLGMQTKGDIENLGLDVIMQDANKYQKGNRLKTGIPIDLKNMECSAKLKKFVSGMSFKEEVR